MLYLFILLLSIILYFFFNDYDYSPELKYRQKLSYYNKLHPIFDSPDYFPPYNPCPKNCIGIEIELEFLKPEPDISKWKKLLNKIALNETKWSELFFIKYDYTIPYGIEINFQPMTFQDYKKINWDPFFNLLIEETGDTHIDTGLHLHIPYTENQNKVYNILELLTINQDYFIKFMKRNNIVFSRFCTFETLKENYLKCIGKLNVININKYIPSIEIRGFKMTLNQTEFDEYINFMKYIQDYDIVKN